MALYFGGGTKESIKALRIKKQMIRLITGINKYDHHVCTVHQQYLSTIYLPTMMHTIKITEYYNS
jgi:hypothetical protein